MLFPVLFFFRKMVPSSDVLNQTEKLMKQYVVTLRRAYQERGQKQRLLFRWNAKIGNSKQLFNNRNKIPLYFAHVYIDTNPNKYQYGRDNWVC